MNILIPTIGFARTGGYRVLSELVNQWEKMGHSVTFLANELSERPYFPFSGKIIWINYLGKAVILPEPYKPKNKKLNGGLNLLGLYLAVNRIGAEFDIIIANHSLSVYPVVFANCGNGRKIYYIQAYEPEYYSTQKGIKARILEWLSKKSYDADIIQICNSKIYIGYKNIKALSWVPPGIDFQLFYPKLKNSSLSQSTEIVLGCIGRLEPSKGIRYALEAYDKLYKMDHRFRLRVAYGNLPSDWQHNGLTIVTPANDKELGAYYRSLDILLAPGIVQIGAPHYPVMEGMACGIPVVTTGYMPANTLNSWIVPIKNSDAIVDAVLSIVKTETLTQVVNATRDISVFTWPNVAEEMMTLMQEK